MQYNLQHVLAEERQNHLFSAHIYMMCCIWVMFVEMNIHDDDVLDQRYDFLCAHSSTVEQFFSMSLYYEVDFKPNSTP